MKSSVATVAGFLAASSIGLATFSAAGAPPGGDPPSGWEVAPPAPKTAVKAIDRCGDDATCHVRQTGLDQPIESTPWSVVEVDFASLPLVKKLEAPKGGPFVKDAPPVRLIDGAGRPFPWPDGAKGEVRVMPAGKLGEVAWGNDWFTPFFQDSKYRSMGYGVTRTVDEKAPNAFAGAIELVSIDRGAAGLVYDHIVGKLEGSPQIAATLWEHADAARLPGGFGHAFRAEGEEASIVILLPEVFIGMEGRHVKLRGGFFAGSRFSTDQAFTRYTMPVGTRDSGTVTFSVIDTQRRRWLDAGEARTKPPRLESFVVASSRGSVEKAPRVVIFRRESRSDF